MCGTEMTIKYHFRMDIEFKSDSHAKVFALSQPEHIIWSCWMFSLLGYHEWCCYEHSHTSFCVAMFLCPLELLDYMENLCGHVSQDHQTIFQSGRTLLHSHEQYLRVRVSPASPTLEGSTFLTIAIFVVVMWYLIVVFIWMCLMAYDADHVFMF